MIGSPGRVAAVAVVAAFAITALAGLPKALSRLSGDGRSSREVTPALRPLAPAFQTDIDRRYLVAAKAYIPLHASYFIDQGTGVVSGDPVSAASVKPVTEFALYPRHPLLAPRPGAWLICYGCTFQRWAGKASFSWELGPIAVGRISP